MGIISDIIGLSGHLILLLLQKLQVTPSYTYIRILKASAIDPPLVVGAAGLGSISLFYI